MTTKGSFEISDCADCRQIVTWLNVRAHIMHILSISHEPGVVTPVNKMGDLFRHRFSALHL